MTKDKLTKIVHTEYPQILNRFLFKSVFLLIITSLLNCPFAIFVKFNQYQITLIYMKIE